MIYIYIYIYIHIYTIIQEQKIQAFPSVRLYRRGADKKKAWGRK